MSGTSNSVVDMLGAHANSSGLQKWMENLRGSAIKESGLDRQYISFEDAGIQLRVDEKSSTVRSISLYSGHLEDFAVYEGVLPKELDFGLSQDEVRKRLGEPSKSGTKARSSLGSIPQWDRFDCGTYSLHVQYADDMQSIDLITLMTPDAVP